MAFQVNVYALICSVYFCVFLLCTENSPFLLFYVFLFPLYVNFLSFLFFVHFSPSHSYTHTHMRAYISIWFQFVVVVVFSHSSLWTLVELINKRYFMSHRHCTRFVFVRRLSLKEFYAFFFVSIFSFYRWLVQPMVNMCVSALLLLVQLVFIVPEAESKFDDGYVARTWFEQFNSCCHCSCAYGAQGPTL